jgi:hypothetical protein
MLIIPRQSMPEDCESCPCYYDGYCMALLVEPNKGTECDYNLVWGSRQPWCPLIEKKPGIRLLRE